MQQKEQLEHDSLERSLERHMAWRRQVYLEAAEAISRLNSVLTVMIPDLTSAQDEISTEVRKDTAKITTLHLIASKETISAIDAYMAAFLRSYTKLMLHRSVLLGIRERLDPIALVKAQIEPLRDSQKALFELLTLLPSVIVSARKDLEISIDESWYSQHYVDSTAAASESVHGVMKTLDVLVAIADETHPNPGASQQASGSESD